MCSRLLCILLVLVSTNCVAEDAEYICPPYITVVASIKSPPPGWHVLKPDSDKSAKHFLEYVVFTDGHPRDLAYLRPTLEKRMKFGENEFIKSVFDFSGASPDGIYLVCGYARTTEILLKPIGTTHTICEVVRSDEIKTIKSIKCK